MAENRVHRETSARDTGKALGPVLITNPLSDGIARTWPLLGTLRFSPLYIVPSLLTAVVLLLVLAILIILWPYGWIAVVSRFLWGFVSTALEQIRQMPTYAEKMPFTIALGIYFLIWLPLGALCLPLLLVGLIGQLFAGFFGDSGSIEQPEPIAAKPPKVDEREQLVKKDVTQEAKLVICHIPGVCIEGENYRVDITAIEKLPNSKIRINFLNHNKSSGIIHAFVEKAGSFFVDEHGHQYDCVGCEHIGGGRDIIAGVPIQYAMVFNAPNRPPKKISLLFVGSPGAEKGMKRKWSFPTIECNWKLEQQPPNPGVAADD